MSKEEIKQIIQRVADGAGLMETGIKGVQIFNQIEPIICAPVVYEPCIVAIVSGKKMAILDGISYQFDQEQFMCCPISMPVEAGTPEASPENPLYGVYISLDTRVMTNLAIELESTKPAMRHAVKADVPQAFTLSKWDDDFTEALVRLMRLIEDPIDMKLLGEGRLYELYYTLLKGEAGASVRRSFGVGNDIARSIEYIAAQLNQTISIDDMADFAGMSRAVFHRKFKQATRMSPIQFMKSMRLNHAAMQIAKGVNVNVAAMEVGYVSSSQFSREFKRLYGRSPKQWGSEQKFAA
ncbi:AraC family transcriptional regulator [Sphingorhabdus lutea]|uniref:AraC family transcriptional regulator n=1 Tax=Sphingorhabdus lutea TaxID=1913578 RepID=A0A1L3JEH2_9SPHN|nr:AraC family transcriptional regulator [Sphingorhabdus lutea]APG63530.1 AraC family transcriptional regulator [Sphingorhabdus lutea]